MNIISLKNYFITILLTIKNEGLKAAWRKFRWHLVGVVITYYLIRDTLLYIVVPLLIYNYL